MEETVSKEGKRKFALWIRESTLDEVRKWQEADNCSSMSEFIEKAILFYAGYISCQGGKDYIPNIVTSTLKSIITESDNRTCRMLFKIAVELSLALNVIAASHNIQPESVERLRGECVREVKRINGSIRMEDAARWQEG